MFADQRFELKIQLRKWRQNNDNGKEYCKEQREIYQSNEHVKS